MNDKALLSIALLLIAAIPAEAMASPAYLECEFVSNGQAFPVSVTADEAAGTVALFMPTTGNRQQLVGTFTADRVMFATRSMSYVIDRVNLTITRNVHIIQSTEVGKCKVQTPPKRAF